MPFVKWEMFAEPRPAYGSGYVDFNLIIILLILSVVAVLLRNQKKPIMIGSLLINIFAIGQIIYKTSSITGRLPDGTVVTAQRQYGFYVIIVLLVLRAITVTTGILKKEQQ